MTIIATKLGAIGRLRKPFGPPGLKATFDDRLAAETPGSPRVRDRHAASNR